MEYTVAAYTNTGAQKAVSQDSLCIRRAALPGVGESVLAVVCDGMGGLQKGELASGLCVQMFGAWFDQNLYQLPALCGSGFQPVKEQWGQLLYQLHARLSGYAAQQNMQLGTTVTALLTYASRYLTVNIGDSRIYLRTRRLEQLTQDQSLVAREVELGRITAEDARHHPQRNILLQCLGAGGLVTPVFTEGLLPGNALLLLCSDGLVHELSAQELEDALQQFQMGTKEAMTKALSGLVERCKQRGELDDITAVLVKTMESGVAPPHAGMRGVLARLCGRKPVETSSPALLETAQIAHIPQEVPESNQTAVR